MTTTNDTRTVEQTKDDIKRQAKSENEAGKAKRKVEGDQAQWTSPEETSLSGGEVLPDRKVVADKPDPANDPQLQEFARAHAQKR